MTGEEEVEKQVEEMNLAPAQEENAAEATAPAKKKKNKKKKKKNNAENAENADKPENENQEG